MIARIGSWLASMSFAGNGATSRGTHRRRCTRPRAEWILLATCAAATVIALAVVAVTSLGYYDLAPAQRPYDRALAIFTTTGAVGTACGLIGAGLLLANFAYLLRKEARPLRHVGSLRMFLDWHVIGGLTSVGFIALHANFHLRNRIAQAAVWALTIVVITGLIGRYLLRYVPRTSRGARLTLEAFEDELMAMVDEIRGDVVDDPRAVTAMQQLVDELAPPSSPPSLGQLATRLRRARACVAPIDRALAAHAGTRPHRHRARRLHRDMARLATQASVIHVADRVMNAWRAFHRAFALLLLAAMVAHIAIATYYGYGL